MSKGFGGMPGNMQKLLKQAQKMQEELQQAQALAELSTAEASSGGGMVKAVVNGKHKIESITINAEVVNPDDVEILQDLIIAAVNEASAKIEDEMKQKLSGITGGMQIPGLS